MGEMLQEYYDVILLIVGNLLVILKMLNTLKGNVKVAVDKLKSDYDKVEKENVTLRSALDKVLTFVELESDLKQLNKIIPDEYKDKYTSLKEETLKVHEEIKKLV